MNILLISLVLYSITSSDVIFFKKKSFLVVMLYMITYTSDAYVDPTGIISSTLRMNKIGSH
jgi:hypothetical protein